MINHLTGTMLFKGKNHVVLETGGIGYKVYACLEMLTKMKAQKEYSLWTHQVVREDTIELYGFDEKQELEFFEMLINVSGIGPRSALAILSLAPVKTLTRAIAAEDTTYLTKVSGIGKKTAGKIVLELGEKITLVESDNSDGDRTQEGEALEALASLGYSLRDAREALKKVPQETEGANEKIKAALKILNESQ